MALIDLIQKEIIKVPLSSNSKREVIRELVQILIDSGKITESEKVFSALMMRETLGSTGLEQGIAIPHAKTDAVRSLTLAIGIKPSGIDFEALDGGSSRLFFLMLAPPDQSGPHIEALAEIARLTRSAAFCKSLLEAANPQEVVRLFQVD